MNLDDLARGRTDKSSEGHNYCPHYERHLDPATIDVLVEVGVWQGGSLRMWRDWLKPEARIFGIEKDANWAHVCDDIEVTIIPGDATEVDVPVARMDVLVDDGSHVPWEQEKTFLRQWPQIRAGGWYVIEDLDGRELATLNALIEGDFLDPRAVCELHIYEQIVFLRKRP